MKMKLTKDLNKTPSSFNNSERLTFAFQDLTADDDIYMFHCPANFDHRVLLGENLNFTHSNRIKNSNEVFKLNILRTEDQKISLALPVTSRTGNLKNINLSGHISIQNVVNKSGFKSESTVEIENNEVKFPKNLKSRHPLLGVHWRTELKVANEAITRNYQLSKMLKKSKKIKTECEPLTDMKRKRKHSESESIYCKKFKE